MDRTVGPEVKPRLVDSQNRVAIPADILKHLNVKAGDHVAFAVEDGVVVVRRVKWIVDK